jgi:mono/diheme cytochrome c family protein
MGVLRKVLKVLAVIMGVLVVAAIGCYAYAEATYKIDYSSTPKPAIVASKDPEVIKRGEYVFHSIAHCSACHVGKNIGKDRKRNDRSPPLGGFVFDVPGFGKYVAANLTSDPDTGLGKVGDGEIARTIRHGVARDGRLAPFMQFAVGEMADEDLTAVVSYIRTLPAAKNEVEKESWGFVAKLLAKKFPPRMGAIPKYVPPGDASVARGEYIANGPGVCSGCHTPIDMMSMKPSGPKFSGSNPEPDHDDSKFEIVAPNLTPDPKTGHIVSWTEEVFLARFRAGPAHKGSPMPWENFAEMTDEDIKSLYRYLKTLPPTEHLTGPPHRPAGWKPAK